jgi:DNA integrity scanning protein DisA with diadenylate cyclase activity
MIGFINQKKVNQNLNISSIMRLKKMKFKDLYSVKDFDTILLRDSVLKRFTLIITSYFCLGTELRFLKQMKL